MSFPSPKPRPLSKQRTQECHPFQVIGVGYTGPIYYSSKNKVISKSNIFLFSCSVSRAIHLELVPNLSTQEFIKSTKIIIARWGSSKIFQDGAKWLIRINKDGKLSNESVAWEFNPSKAPWWVS